MSWRRNFADYQNALSQKSADKLVEEFAKCYEEAANEIIPIFMDVYEKACASVGSRRNLVPATLFSLDAYWDLHPTSKNKINDLGHLIISLTNYQFHIMYADVFEGITPGGIAIPCIVPAEKIQEVIDGVWGRDKKNWKERVWLNMTNLWDKLTGELMEAVIKKRDSKTFQVNLQKAFGGSRKSLNSTIMIDVSRIQAKAATLRYRISRGMAASISADIAAYTMTYGDESEISALSMEDVAAVNTLSDTVENEVNANEGIMTVGILGSIFDFVTDLIDIATGGDEGNGQLYIWICEGDDLVCEDCEEYDGVLITGAQADEIFPLHPNCRCVLEPLMEDDDDGEDDTIDADDFTGGMDDGGFSDAMDDFGGYLDSIGAL